MPNNVYPNLPSSVIETIEIDTDNNTVSVIYKSNNKRYTYQSENATQFEQQFLAEFDQGIDTGYADVSVGRFINKNVNGGGLTLLTD